MRPTRSIPKKPYPYGGPVAFFNQFSYIGSLSEGFARVKMGDNFKNQKCGFINSKLEIAIPLIYANVRDYHEGMAAVKKGNWASGYWGFINKQGEMVIPQIMHSPGYFFEGLAKVVLSGEWCFINKMGDKVISLIQYTGSSTFHNGYALVFKRPENRNWESWSQELFGIIDKQGNEVVPCRLLHYNPDSICNTDRIPEIIKLWEEGALASRFR